MNKITLKKWTRTEWLLLLAPLVIVIGIGAMNFAPQLQRAWREWREYGSNKPFAILHLQSKGEKQSEPSFGSFAFSPDGQQIAISETVSYGSGIGYPTRVWLWRLGKEKPFASWLASESEDSISQVTQLRYMEKQTISVSTITIAPRSRGLAKTFFEEKRDARNGRLISRKRLQALLEADSPAELDLLIPSGSPIKSHQRRKNGISVKVSFQQTAMRRPQDIQTLVKNMSRCISLPTFRTKKSVQTTVSRWQISTILLWARVSPVKTLASRSRLICVFCFFMWATANMSQVQ